MIIVSLFCGLSGLYLIFLLFHSTILLIEKHFFTKSNERNHKNLLDKLN